LTLLLLLLTDARLGLGARQRNPGLLLQDAAQLVCVFTSRASMEAKSNETMCRVKRVAWAHREQAKHLISLERKLICTGQHH
jgi:hypothetical protein